MPAAETPIRTEALIDHIRVRFHDTHRRELPELIALARRVEKAHPEDIDTPHGLTQALEAMTTELEAHMRAEEDGVFAAFRSGTVRDAVVSIPDLNKDHDSQQSALNRIAAITHGFRLPRNACATWRRLYAGLGKLAEDLDEHRYLEDEVLFPRLEEQA
ncbi:hemerythrin domain-containing protein [Roseovarius sp. SCSIO 43702]|uniref:hemerythrin domain-containing protein n=1 Tax=Roseovarius sp. SCSIO 43702 TaxID=2823043 RepID=UPI001C73D5D7|nr:hemerythrin domain-containing protein [Roseovarius sp. SCSIO 43702]QYX56021.1 hemerythrin domain-containing protein [Roseovarius sp. SCSIO 43702]